MIETADYDVTLVIRLSTSVHFAPTERDGPISKFDAIENALGRMPSDVLTAIQDGFGGEFSVSFDNEATKEGRDR